MKAEEKLAMLYTWLDEERNMDTVGGLWESGYDDALDNVISYLEKEGVASTPSEQHQGIALRDYFAAQALSALIIRDKPAMDARSYTLREAFPNDMAKLSLEYADEMLKARM